jgi:Xaa-Pro aminopeptidase
MVTLLLRIPLPMLFLALAVMAASPADAQVYRWVDEDGNVHYTDSLPPERARDARRVYSRDGSPIREVERAPTEAELREREQRRRLAEERQAEEREARRQQAEYDRMLLRTFNDENHLERTREDRLEAMAAQQRVLRIRNTRDQEELEELRERAAQAERTGQGDPEAIYSRIRRTEARIAERNERMAELDRGMDQLDQEFDNHLKRFRELRQDG